MTVYSKKRPFIPAGWKVLSFSGMVELQEWKGGEGYVAE